MGLGVGYSIRTRAGPPWMGGSQWFSSRPMSWWPHEVQLPDRAEPEIRPTQTRGRRVAAVVGSSSSSSQPASLACLRRQVGGGVSCSCLVLVSSSGQLVLAHPSLREGRLLCTLVLWYSPDLVWSGSVRACPLSLSPCAHCCNCCYCLALSGPCCLFSLDQVPDSHTLASSGGQPRPHPSHHVRHTPFSLRPPDMPLALHLRSDA